MNESEKEIIILLPVFLILFKYVGTYKMLLYLTDAGIVSNKNRL